MYSMSRRNAPIYWQLQVPSKTWGIWLYAPRLSREMLFAIVQETEQRQRLADQQIARLQREAESGSGGRKASEVAKELDAEQRLAVELATFRAEAERIANLGWEPDLDDGMVLNAAPLAEPVPSVEGRCRVPRGAPGRQVRVGDGGPLRGSAVTILRERLGAELAGKVERHGVVIWDDPERAYADVVTEVAPAGVAVHVFDRSWFVCAARSRSLLAGQEPPSLVVYVPAKPAEPDPLEELRAVGARFRVTLPTLLKNALAGRLTEQRITQIAQQCSTLREAEAAVEGGGTSVDARLISIVGDTRRQRHRDRARKRRARRPRSTERGLDEVVRTTLAESLGGDFGELRGSRPSRRCVPPSCPDRHTRGDGRGPDDLAGSFEPPHREINAGPARQSSMRLRSDPALRSEYVDLAQQADEQLHLGALLEWHDGLSKRRRDSGDRADRPDRRLPATRARGLRTRHRARRALGWRAAGGSGQRRQGAISRGRSGAPSAPLPASNGRDAPVPSLASLGAMMRVVHERRMAGRRRLPS